MSQNHSKDGLLGANSSMVVYIDACVPYQIPEPPEILEYDFQADSWRPNRRQSHAGDSNLVLYPMGPTYGCAGYFPEA